MGMRDSSKEAAALKARRIALKLSEADAERICGELSFADYSGSNLRAAYSAALSALEAEREPVCPEGVRLHTREDGYVSVMVPHRSNGEYSVASVSASGAVTFNGGASYVSPSVLRFVADLADCRAAQHAVMATERQRLLDVWEAAQKALRDTRAAEYAAALAYDAADRACREAGL
jgi:hypothetical protein